MGRRDTTLADVRALVEKHLPEELASHAVPLLATFTPY